MDEILKANSEKLINNNEKILKTEFSMCRKLYKENNGKCAWGRCESCGVIPLLYKLYKGELIEDTDEVKKVKDSILKRE